MIIGEWLKLKGKMVVKVLINPGFGEFFNKMIALLKYIFNIK